MSIPNEKESNPFRPDPMFKSVTRDAALAAGLELLDIELPQLLRADLALAVPQDKDLSGTLFDFLAPYSILEFKSENDTFDRYELAKNLARSLLFFSENKTVEYSQLLTVFVCAQQPDGVLKHLTAEGTPAKSDPNRPWLFRCRIWSLNIAIVVCRLLPIEKRYYGWFQFAPTNSRKWREFVTILVHNGETAWLEQVKKIRVKEVKLMTLALTEDLKGMTPEEQEEFKKDWINWIEAEIDTIEEIIPGGTNELLIKRLTKLSPAMRQHMLELLRQTDIENQLPE
jgi:hypothetical protein